jgi:hypothetical protein
VTLVTLYLTPPSPARLTHPAAFCSPRFTIRTLRRSASYPPLTSGF